VAVTTLECGESRGNPAHLLMLWPSACLCLCTWLRVDDGLISRAGDAD